ncbi:unnamed protein product [Orchesella dallaii]|uniref:Galectin n=1 Tax=Orchesella dallaii TaxID=48710 RepID=A0ABP1PI80_9HEXA
MKYFLVLLIFHACHSMLVNNPQIPFTRKLSNGFSVGTKITITGQTLPGAYRFAINIRNGWKEEGGTVMFHFNPRFDEPNVVIATHFDGLGWMDFGTHRFPKENHFLVGNNFTVEILCQKEQFSVAVDGDPFLVYKYMIPLEIADTLEIKGVRNRDVEIFLVSVTNLPKEPIDLSGIAETDVNLNESVASANNVSCGSSSPFLVLLKIFLILFVLLALVFFMVILWNTGLLDFSQPKK